MAIQVNGKLRGTIVVAKDIDRDALIVMAKSQDNVVLHVKDREIKHKRKNYTYPGPKNEKYFSISTTISYCTHYRR